ncbi:PREDICTED: keratin, type I cytoskeletal 20 [Galeopterus variegatus]|uniref:Keratin, type I cytoskeletal 20 n=1 Tax=Galeopterus variegatus TaxID=482537 RepID=A0ABM0RUK0_GALVR|nr:PREDICTED: keratin, type I cytoskeletal 20 [Galeopterus variegatus]
MCYAPRFPDDFSSRSFHGDLRFALEDAAFSTRRSIYRKWGVQYREFTPSVYGGAGGFGTRVSTPRFLGSCGNDFIISCGGLFVGNEKMTMQNLNDRLASYLEKVRSLEQSNFSLDVQIKQWCQTNVPSTGRDYSSYYKRITELQDQIRDAQLQNARCFLQVGNAKLAAEDFRLKYETERGFHLTVEADIRGQNKVIDDLTVCKTDLEIQIEGLNKELVLLKKEHQEEVDGLRGLLGNKVKVEVDAAPSQSLSVILTTLREKYEVTLEKIRQEITEQFQRQIEILEHEVTVQREESEKIETQLLQLRQTYEHIETELRSSLSTKESLHLTVESTDARFKGQLVTIQEKIHFLEAELTQIRNDTERQKNDYNILLDTKSRLEQEIATYSHLLNGEDVKSTEYQLDTLEERG